MTATVLPLLQARPDQWTEPERAVTLPNLCSVPTSVASSVVPLAPTPVAAWLLRHPLSPLVRWPDSEDIPSPSDAVAPLPPEIWSAIESCGGAAAFTAKQRRLQAWVVPTLISTFGTGRDGSAVRTIGFEPLLARIQAGEPSLVVVPHLGPFLSVTSHLLAAGASVTESTLFDPLEIEALAARYASWGCFASHPAHQPVWVGSAVAPMVMVKALRRGEVVCWQPDVPVVASANTMPGRFLGIDKELSTLPLYLQQRSGAAVFLGSARLQFDAPLAPRLEVRYEEFPADHDQERFVRTLYARCEELVLEQLDQWYRWFRYPAC